MSKDDGVRRRKPKRRNPYAKALEDPMFRQKKIGPKKGAYNRNVTKRELEEELYDEYGDDG